MPNDPPAPALGAQQRGPLRQPDPEQYCARCGERLVRRRYPSGRSEWPGAFRARKYCSSACVGLAQRGSTNRRIAELEAAIHAQAARLAELEPCYEDARSTAARLLIEQEQYAQTVRNLTERAEFANQRADAQAARLALAERVIEIAGITHYDQTGSPAETISRLRDERDAQEARLAVVEPIVEEVE